MVVVIVFVRFCLLSIFVMSVVGVRVGVGCVVVFACSFAHCLLFECVSACLYMIVGVC